MFFGHCCCQPDDLWFLAGEADANGVALRALQLDGTIEWERTLASLTEGMGKPTTNISLFCAAVQSPYLFVMVGRIDNTFYWRRLNALTGDTQITFAGVPGTIVANRAQVYISGAVLGEVETLRAYTFDGSLQWKRRWIQPNGRPSNIIASAMCVDHQGDLLSIQRNDTLFANSTLYLKKFTAAGNPSWQTPDSGNSSSISVVGPLASSADNLYEMLRVEGGSPQFPGALSWRPNLPQAKQFITLYYRPVGIAAGPGNRIYVRAQTSAVVTSWVLDAWDVSTATSPVKLWSKLLPPDGTFFVNVPRMVVTGSGYIVVVDQSLVGSASPARAWVFNVDGEVEYTYACHGTQVRALQVLNGSPGLA